MTDCNHEFIGEVGVKCDKEKGHENHHECYYETASSKTETSFKIYEWNDAGQEPIYPEEKGVAFPVNYDDGHDERQKTMSLAIFDAKKNLPEGSVFEIRAKSMPKAINFPDDYGRLDRTKDEMAKNWGIAWYHVPKVEQPEGFESIADLSTEIGPLFESDVDKGKEYKLGGYILLARIKV